MGDHSQDRPHDGNGKFVRSPETAARDAQAAELRAQGQTYQQIADELGYDNKGNAYRAVQRALRAIVEEPAERVRTLELQRLDAMYEAVMGVLERQHVTVSHGKIIYVDGSPLIDDGPVLQAVDRLLKIQERRARILGLDAPSRVSVDADQLGAEILEMLTSHSQDHGDPDDDGA